MAKRRNVHGQARKEEMEMMEDQEEEAGVFRRASADRLKGRKIVTARRPRVAAPAAKPAGQANNTAGAPKNPFGAFKGLTSSTLDPPAPATNAFSGFTGLTSNSKPNTNAFSGFTGLTSKPPVPPSQPTSSAVINPTTQPMAATNGKTGTGKNYAECMHELNKGFATWIEDQIQENPCSAITDAVNDYLTYVEQIATKHASTKPKDEAKRNLGSVIDAVGPPAAAASKPFSFAEPVKAPVAEPVKAPASSSAFAFGAPPTSTTSGFNFGGAGATATTTTEAGDEEEVGREEATVVLKGDNNTESDETTTLELEKAKLLQLKESGEWGDKGVHPLKVLVHKTTKKGRVLMRNSTGNVVLNASLYKNLKIQVQEKNGKKLGVAMILMVEDKPTRCVIRVRGEKVAALEAALKSAIDN